jgi:transcription elongation factor SPT4
MSDDEDDLERSLGGEEEEEEDEEDIAEDDEDDGYDDDGGPDGKRQRFAQIPNEIGTTLRACIPCMLVKTFAQFKNHGCENCESILDLVDSDQLIMDVTTAGFEGFSALTRPAESWVARWQFCQDMIPGVYALKVDRDVPEDVAITLEQNNFVNVGRMLLKEASKSKADSNSN